MEILLNSNRGKFAVRQLAAAALCGIDISDLSAVEAFFEENADHRKALFDLRLYPNCTAEELGNVLRASHPYSLLSFLSSPDKLVPVCPLYARAPKLLDEDTVADLAKQDSGKYYSIYIADSSMSQAIPKDTYVEVKTKESRVSGKLISQLWVNPGSVIAFNSNDCAKTIFKEIEEFGAYYFAYWDFDFDVSLNSTFPNRRKLITRAYQQGGFEFIPSPAIGVIPYEWSKEDFWGLPPQFSEARLLGDIEFTYSTREIMGKLKGPVSPQKMVHKNILTNIPEGRGTDIDAVRSCVAYHWFCEELPEANMDIFIPMAQCDESEDFTEANKKILQRWAQSTISLTSSAAKQQGLAEVGKNNTAADHQNRCASDMAYLYEIISRADLNYQYMINTVTVEKLFS